MEPENVDVLGAFMRVVGCTHPTFSGVPGPPIWSDIRTVLDLHDEWSPEIQERLGSLFLQIREISNREARDDAEDTEVTNG